MEYVNKVTVRGAIRKACFGLVLDKDTEKVLMDAIDETPAATIVLCESCKHYFNDGRESGCRLFEGMTMPLPVDFCSRGERKEGVFNL